VPERLNLRPQRASAAAPGVNKSPAQKSLPACSRQPPPERSTSMVRRGSTVRVRQRALQRLCEQAILIASSTGTALAGVGQNFTRTTEISRVRRGLGSCREPQADRLIRPERSTSSRKRGSCELRLRVVELSALPTFEPKNVSRHAAPAARDDSVSTTRCSSAVDAGHPGLVIAVAGCLW